MRDVRGQLTGMNLNQFDEFGSNHAASPLIASYLMKHDVLDGAAPQPAIDVIDAELDGK